MASSYVYSTFKNFLRAQFSEIYPVLDWDQLDPVLVTEQNPFLVIEEVTSSEDPEGFSTPERACVLEDGVFLVHAFTPAPEGSESARRIVDEVRARLRRQVLDLVHIDGVGPPEPEVQNEGVWTSASMTVRYSARLTYTPASGANPCFDC
jgi:hypothetical protein